MKKNKLSMPLRLASVFNPSKLTNVTLKRFPLKGASTSVVKNLLSTVVASVRLAFGSGTARDMGIPEMCKSIKRLGPHPLKIRYPRVKMNRM